MSSAPDVELFKGSNWEECHKFILAIRTRALWEGKLRDSEWKAGFAATLFWRKALLWHSRLPEDVREDWSKLEIALLERWLPPDDDDEPQMKPTPAAAPSLNHNEKINLPLQGVLKLVLDGSNTKSYVRFTSSICVTTTNANEAVRVQYSPLANTALLERIDHSGPSWLAVQWTSSTPNIGDGSSDYAYIPSVDQISLKSSWTTAYPFQPITCTVMDNGEVIPVWKKDNASKITLVAMLFGGTSCLVPDAEAFIRKNPSAKRGNSLSRRQTKLDGFIHRGGSNRIHSKSRFDFGTLRMYPLGLQKPVTARTV